MQLQICIPLLYISILCRLPTFPAVPYLEHWLKICAKLLFSVISLPLLLLARWTFVFSGAWRSSISPSMQFFILLPPGLVLVRVSLPTSSCHLGLPKRLRINLSPRTQEPSQLISCGFALRTQRALSEARGKNVQRNARGVPVCGPAVCRFCPGYLAWWNVIIHTVIYRLNLLNLSFLFSYCVTEQFWKARGLRARDAPGD